MKKDSTMDIAFSTDDNYVKHLSACIASILCNAGKCDHFNFYILNSGLKEANKQKLLKLKKIKNFNMSFLEVNQQDFNICPLTNNKHITITAYYRFLIPKLLKELPKVLYLDCDIIVKNSLRAFFNTDITDKYAAVVSDIAPIVDNLKVKEKLEVTKYFNSGVILLNINEMNKDNIVDKLFENTIKLSNENKITWEDQCVLNYTLKDKLKFVPQKYNLQLSFFRDKEYVLKYVSQEEYNDAIKNHVIIHYTTDKKPWNCDYKFKTGKEYFRYLDKTCFARSRFEKIFSIRNSYDKKHKVINLLGIKLKIKRKVNM